MSDNTKTFKACSHEVMKITCAEEVRQYMTNQQVELRWRVWECLVQSVKCFFIKIIGRSTLTSLMNWLLYW